MMDVCLSRTYVTCNRFVDNESSLEIVGTGILVKACIENVHINILGLLDTNISIVSSVNFCLVILSYKIVPFKEVYLKFRVRPSQNSAPVSVPKMSDLWRI